MADGVLLVSSSDAEDHPRPGLDAGQGGISRLHSREVVQRLEGQQGFAVLPGRWVVERTFAWLLRWRRLVRDYEKRIDVSQNMIYLAMSSLLLYRISFH